MLTKAHSFIKKHTVRKGYFIQWQTTSHNPFWTNVSFFHGLVMPVVGIRKKFVWNLPISYQSKPRTKFHISLLAHSRCFKFTTAKIWTNPLSKNFPRQNICTFPNTIFILVLIDRYTQKLWNPSVSLNKKYYDTEQLNVWPSLGIWRE